MISMITVKYRQFLASRPSLTSVQTSDPAVLHAQYTIQRALHFKCCLLDACLAKPLVLSIAHFQLASLCEGSVDISTTPSVKLVSWKAKGSISNYRIFQPLSSIKPTFVKRTFLAINYPNRVGL